MSSESLQAELLQWHYHMGHCSFKKLQILSALGVIPRKLPKVNSPNCAGCLYCAMTKRPWRTKSANNRGSIWEASAPGYCVLLDHMESRTPRFIAQLKGKLTKQSYRGATIFLDHHIDLTYVHLQKVLSSKETVEAKKAFEAYSHTYRVRINN